MTFVPFPQSFVVHALHPTDSKCPPGAPVSPRPAWYLRGFQAPALGRTQGLSDSFDRTPWLKGPVWSGGMRRRLIPVLLLLAAEVLAVAGVVTWRRFSPLPSGVATHGNSSVAFYFTAQPHRLHPLRAELLWAASALCAIAGVGIARWRRLASRPAIAA
jgi:hypothetical protein